MQQGMAPPSGFRDLLGPAARRRREIEAVLAELFAAEDFVELRPPAVEYLALYERGRQHAAASAVRFLDRDDRLLALRADFTSAVARAAATDPPGAGQVRKYWYAGSVFRRAETSGGMFTELGQAGAELIGAGGPEADAGVIGLALRALDLLGIRGARLHLSHAGIAAGLLAGTAPDADELDLARRDLLRHDARALERRLSAWGASQRAQDAFTALLSGSGEPEVLERIAGLSPETDAACGELQVLAHRLSAGGSGVVLDPGEPDHLHYYTGMYFTIYHARAGEPLGRGGRYDGLLRAFGLETPALGFSLALDVLAELT